MYPPYFKVKIKMVISRFLRTIEKDDIIAVFHALHPDPIFIPKEMWNECQNSRFSSNQDITKLLIEKQLFLEDSSLDENYLNELRTTTVEAKAMSILYLILTKQCNFKCRQCFQYERHPEIYHKNGNISQVMSIDIARAGIDKFIQHLQLSNYNAYETQIQLYGGEPSLNWETLVFAVDYARYLQSKKELPEDLKLTLVTNGSLIDEARAQYLAEKKVLVSLSIDGRQWENDKYRVMANGQGTYTIIMETLRRLQKYKADITFSITITPDIVVCLPEIIEWSKREANIDVVGFNMIGGESYSYIHSQMEKERYDAYLADGLIEAFKKARQLNVYEDRMGRKALNFVEHTFLAVDCGAINNQLVIQPDGQIAFCHASEKYNIGSVFDKKFVIFDHPKITEWKLALPINNLLCQECYALSICGYGCFHNVIEQNEKLQNRDKQFCLHTKKNDGIPCLGLI